jgi:NAD(P)H dehydrogenase (quinone)
VRSVDGVEVKLMTAEEPDNDWLASSRAVIFGCPTYWGGVSWQLKKFFDTTNVALSGKLTGFFATMHWPSGGGAELTLMQMSASALVHGMLVYSGGVKSGMPPTHFGAVAEKTPVEGLDRSRAIKLGKVIAEKAVELFD